MTALPDADRNRLTGMLALAEAEQNPADGERLAALGAIERLLARHGMRLRDLAVRPAPVEGDSESIMEWRAVIDGCLRWHGSLRPLEGDFLRSLRTFKRLSPKQRATLRAIAKRVGVLEPA